MATFETGRPIVTKEPTITIDNKLEPGTYRFQLVVTRADGTESQPIIQEITIMPAGSRLLGRLSRSPTPIMADTQDNDTPKKQPKRNRKRQSTGRRRKSKS